MKNSLKYKKVLVVYGGWNREREVSLMSTQGIIEALKEKGYQVDSLDFTENFSHNIQYILNSQPDVIFNNIYGRFGEDGCLQGLWEIMRIPYTQSPVRASANAMHKPTTQYILKTHNLPIPENFVFNPKKTKDIPLAFPYVLKPTDDGSSVGISIIHNSDEKDSYFQQNIDTELMAETYIPGHELSVAVFEDGRSGIMEIIPAKGFYDYEAKYIAEDTQYICPAPIPEVIYKKSQEISLKVFEFLGCTGVARVDIRYNPEQGVEGLYILEVNTVPGLTSHSIVPKIAQTLGVSFSDLMQWIVETAKCRP